MIPCEKEEDIHRLSRTADNNVTRLTDIEKRQISIQADVSYIKGRIDNGLSSTVKDVHENLVKLIPVIDRHTALEKRVEDFFWATVKAIVWAISIGALSLMVWGLLHGWKP